MVLVGHPFLLATIATVLLLQILWLRIRRMEVLAAISLLFILRVSDSIGDIGCLLAMAAIGWLLTQLVSRHKNSVLLVLGICAVIAMFLLSRRILPHAPALSIGRTIGLSYIMFRVIHLVVDAHSDELPPRFSLREYICYLFCYLTFLAGPIQRVQDFAAQARRPSRITLREAASANAPLIITGYLKVTALAGGLFACFTWSQQTGMNVPASVMHAIGWLTFATYLYFSFAGYTDVVLGIAGLIELDLPPNFDKPFAAANFLDLWSRWHITLSDWFKIYVFNPVVKSMISTQRPALVPYLGAVGYFITFFLMGLWHGIDLRFALYGLCLGAGTSVNKLYQYTLLRRLGRSRTNLLTRHPLYTPLARALALSFFIIALGFLWIVDQPTKPSSLAMWAEGAIFVFIAMLLFSFLQPAHAKFVAALRLGKATRVAFHCVQVVVVLAYLLLLDSPVPPLLYEFF